MAAAGLAAGALEGAAGGVEPVPAARLAFGAGNQIFTMSADGSGRTKLTGRAPADRSVSGQPAWSPDGASIAFVRAETAHSGRTAIWTMEADGSGAHAVTSPPAHGVNVGSPAWSPDGTRLAFAGNRFLSSSETASLVTVGADGTGALTIVSETAHHSLLYISAPSWSPDGQRLLYTRTRLDRHGYFRPTIYSVAPDGSARRVLARDARGGSWSPDGSRIAFASVRDRNGSTCGSDECDYDGEIYTMNADGSDLRRLTSSEANDQSPAWSSDGQRIAFQSDRNFPEGENPEIYSVKPDGSCLTWLTNGSARSGEPAWDPRAGPSDAGTCGATDRPPLVDFDSGPITSFSRFRLYWLGTSATSGLLLNDSAVRADEVDLNYDDCGRFDPAQCPSSADLQENATCRGHPFQFVDLKPRLYVVRGAVVYQPRSREESTDVYAGATTISIFGNRSVKRVVQALMPVQGKGGSLPRAAFPQRMWHALRRTDAVYRSLGSAPAAGRRLSISTHAVRRRVSLLRKLRSLGPLGHLRCGH